MNYYQLIKPQKSKSKLYCAVLLSLGMLSSSSIIADQSEQNERKKPIGQSNQYSLAKPSTNNHVMLGAFWSIHC